MKPCRILLGCMLASLCLLSGGAWAQIVTEFSAGITPGSGLSSITAGPVADGNLWFTEGVGRIGRITPLGVVTEFSAGISAFMIPRGITAGPDGNLWFTEGGIPDSIGRITPLGVVTEFSAGITNGAIPEGITAGPDGNLWFAESGNGRIGRITPLGVVTEFSAGITAPPFFIAAGPDGNLWFTEPGVGRIGRITPLGVVTEFSAGISAGAGLGGITAGPVADGNVWFTEFNGNRIGRITPLGVVTEFSAGITAGSGPNGITAGPDGNLWFTETNGNGRIGRITPLGVVTEFSCGITPSSGPTGITAGPDGNLWFTEGSDRIGRITTGPPVAPPTIVKSFGAASIPLNGSTSLSFTINNPNASTTLTGVGFDDALPSGLVVSTPNGLTGSCGGGSIAASAGSGFVQLFDATLAASASCTFSVNVTGTTAGTKNNATSAVTSVEGCKGNTASASVTVGAGIVPPTIAKSFGAASIPLNGSTSLSFTINNPNVGNGLTGVGFTDNLPSGLIVATPNGLTGSCGGGTITATAGSGAVSLTGATLAGSASCTFRVNVTGTTAGPKNNTTSAVTSVEGGPGNTASASVTVVGSGFSPPTIAKSFGAASIPLNGSTSLSFTIRNPNFSAMTLTGVGFTDTLPAGLVVSTPNGLAGSCGGGNIVASAGSGAVSLTGATLPEVTSCTFSVNVTGTTSGTKNNTSGAVTSTQSGPGGTASASVTVGPPPCVAPTITSGAPPSGTVGVPYAFTVTASGDPPLTLSVSGLPTGLAFNPASGSISGVPTAAGTSTLTITASNGCQPNAVQTQSLTVVRSASTLSISASPNPAYFGQAVIVIVRAAGGPFPPQGVVLLCAREESAFCPPPFDTAPPGTPASRIRALLSAPLDASGQASFTLRDLSIDNYVLKASYGGDAAHDGSIAGPIDEFVIKGVLLAPPSVALAAPLRATIDVPLFIGVGVTPSEPAPMPTGTVRLYAGADLVGSATLDANGSTQFRIAAAATGTLALHAEYSGDALFPSAASPERLVTIAAGPTAEIPAVGPIGLALLALALAVLGMRPLYRRARRF